MTNNPPFAVLNLDEDEHRYLTALLAASTKVATVALQEVVSMPSSDPRAELRSMLIMGATADMTMSQHLADRLKIANEPLN